MLAYQREIAHAAVDAGADIVFGHGPHVTLPIEHYRGRPIFYGAGSFSFETGHRATKHPDWLGLMVEATIDNARIATVHFQFVRHNRDNETLPRAAGDEVTELAHLTESSAALGTVLTPDGERVAVAAAEA